MSLTDGLIGYWTMNSADVDLSVNRVYDRSGNGHHGTLVGVVGTPTYISGIGGEAIVLTGDSQYLGVGSSQKLDDRVTGAYTRAGWFNPTLTTTENALLFWKSDFQAMQAGGDYYYFRAGRQCPWNTEYNASASYWTGGQWYHIVETYDFHSQTHKAYLDGVLIGSWVADCSPGARNILNVGYNGWSGAIDEIRVYNRALSQSEVAELYALSVFDTTTLSVPEAVLGLATSNITATSVDLSWTVPEGFSGLFGVYRDGVLIAEIGSGEYAARNLEHGTEYSFSVSAISEKRIEGVQSVEVNVSTSTVTGTQVKPHQYLAGKSKPVQRDGHTMLPLTKYSWDFPFELREELARNWGYGLELGDINAEFIDDLSDPESTASRLVSLAQQEPDVFKPWGTVPRLDLPVNYIPETCFILDSQGERTGTFSPAAPQADLIAMGEVLAGPISLLSEQISISLMVNGGERYLGVVSELGPNAAIDPEIASDRGGMEWAEYVSRRKGTQEKILADAVRVASDGAPHVYYFSGGNQFRASTDSFWDQYDWDYQFLKDATDFPNNTMYWDEHTSGWRDNGNALNLIVKSLLTQKLNAHGYVVQCDDPPRLSYEFVCGGWYRPEKSDLGFGPFEEYYGFLKSLYVTGMVGAAAGYFELPANGGFDPTFDSASPPEWLKQHEALAKIHAEFTWLEPFLRDGELLGGPVTSEYNLEQPCYEFPTGFQDTRVLVRKRNNQNRWLISAWAADGVEREVTIDVPVLGAVTVIAYRAGGLYHAELIDDEIVLSVIDNGKVDPAPLDAVPLPAISGLEVAGSSQPPVSLLIDQPDPVPEYGASLPGGYYAGAIWDTITYSDAVHDFASIAADQTLLFPVEESAFYDPLPFYAGQSVRIAPRNNTNQVFIEGTVAARTDEGLSVSVTSKTGSVGVYSDWAIAAPWKIVQSPKVGGESLSGILFKISDTAAPQECVTLTNGRAATAAMIAANVAAGSVIYPIAEFARTVNDAGGIDGDGFTDRYIPARDESECVFRNLKPGNYINDISTRPKSNLFVFDANIDDVVGDTCGINRNSIPTGSAYTTTEPPQTNLDLFMLGGAEAMKPEVFFWTSSEHNIGSACYVGYPSYLYGKQGEYGKANEFTVRLVRREIL